MISVISLSKDLQKVREYTENFESKIKDYKVMGRSEDNAAILLQNAKIVIYHFLLGMNQQGDILAKLGLNLLKNRQETPVTITVCPRSEHLAVHTHDGGGKICRVLLLKLEGQKLIFRNALEYKEEGLGYFFASSFFGYFGDCLILAGLTWYDQIHTSTLVTLEFDTRKNVLREVVRLRQVAGSFYYPVKMVRFGGWVYTTGKTGRILKLRYYA